MSSEISRWIVAIVVQINDSAFWNNWMWWQFITHKHTPEVLYAEIINRSHDFEIRHCSKKGVQGLAGLRYNPEPSVSGFRKTPAPTNPVPLHASQRRPAPVCV